tara:strand:- start:9483 stop:9851 length:369 start_codon:yes stop_codon:yes gene_type:complete
MATLNATIKLVSSDVSADESLNLTTTDALSVGVPTSNLSKMSVATGSAQTIIASNSAFSHVYIKNTLGTSATDFVQIKLGSAAVIKLMVGEAFFAPIYSGLEVAGEAYGGACKVEFGYWTRA